MKFLGDIADESKLHTSALWRTMQFLFLHYVWYSCFWDKCHESGRVATWQER